MSIVDVIHGIILYQHETDTKVVSDVTSTYVVLIGYRHGELGRLYCTHAPACRKYTL